MAAAASNDNIGFVSDTKAMVTINECTELPAPIHSNGLWNTIQSGAMPYALPLLELQMVFIFAITQASHHLLKRFGIPRFTTQLLVRALDPFHFVSLICT
jgi:hypothetical protein